MRITHAISPPNTVIFHIEPDKYELEHLTSSSSTSSSTSSSNPTDNPTTTNTTTTIHNGLGKPSPTALAHRTVRFLLPDAIPSFENVHPDLWALVVLLFVHPFIHKELKLSFVVSRTFADAVKAASHGTLNVFPVDSELVPRQPESSTSTSPHPRRPSVAFNGRVHSTTIATMLGSASAQLVSVDHMNATVGERTSPYPPDALYYSMDRMERKEFRVAMVKTDVESMCEPFGFVHPLTACVGNVLLADALGLNAVHVGSRLADLEAYGNVIRSSSVDTTNCDNGNGRSVKNKHPVRRSASHTHHLLHLDPPPATLKTVSFKSRNILSDYPPSTNSSISPHNFTMYTNTVPFWRALFSAVHLKLEFPLCGASDACIVNILDRLHVWKDVQYCRCSLPNVKCGNCPDCVYYDMTHQAVTCKAALPSSMFSRTWELCATQFPEATANILHLDVPNRWHLFWVGLVTRRDTLPPAKKSKQEQAYNILHVYAQRFRRMRFGLHGGMFPLIETSQRQLVLDGWKHLFASVK